MKKTMLCHAFVTVCVLASNNRSLAQSAGSLDLTFGTTGKVTTAIGSSDEEANAIAVQSDGKLVVAGFSYNSGFNMDFAVARYNTSGTPDNTFGTSGIVTTAVVSSNDNSGNAVVIQPDNKIVVGGYSFVSGFSNDFSLARYNANGSLDNTFGTGGVLTTSLSTGTDECRALALQSDGKIVAVGRSYNGSNYDFAIVRYNTNGSPDNTFGTGGITTTTIGSGNDDAFAMAIQNDGKIVVCGVSHNGTNNEMATVRYNTNGTLDNTFGTAGVVINNIGNYSYAKGVAIQSNGNIVIAGYSNGGSQEDFCAVRMSSTGVPDNSFGTSGVVTTAIGSGNAKGLSVNIQGDGKIVMAGYGNNGTNQDFALVRYNTNGTPDTGFGTGGVVTTPFGSGNDLAYASLIQSDGKIVVCGTYDNGTDFDFAVARYEGASATGINEHTINTMPDLFIYPNPAVDKITVSGLEKVNIIEIYNILGEKVYTRNKFQLPFIEIDLLHFTKGIYYVNISDGQTGITKKIVIQ